jgi:SAM-dependent methyltransferase
VKDISDTLRVEYQNRFEANATYRNAVWKILCKDFFGKFIGASETILDLGAGWGEFTRNIEANKKYAMDLNPDCALRISGYAEFLMQDCSAPWPLANGQLDRVFTSNFLEHLPTKDAIISTLKEALRCLRPGGTIICMGPNVALVPGVYWDYWDHYIPISDKSMAEALELAGFQIEMARARFLPYTMSGGRNPPLLAVKAFLRVPLLWRLFGKQFLVVARKPAS